MVEDRRADLVQFDQHAIAGGSKGGLHPVLVLLGVVGGLKFLGFVGLIIGPIILAMLVTFINIYEEEKNQNT